MPEHQSLYINRELSWLKFNERVLEEAQNLATPLFERLRFVSIFCSNLDEFYMIRVGSLTDQSLLKKPDKDNKSGMTPSQQLEAIFAQTKILLPYKDMAYFNIMSELSRADVSQVDLQSLSEEDYRFLELYFTREIMPIISPQIIDKRHPFPFLKNLEIYVGVQLETKSDFVRLGFIPASGNFPRLIFLPGDDLRFILAEDLIWFFADKVFGNYRILDKTIFRITRNADINVAEALYDEEVDYRDAMQELLNKRKKLAAVRLELQNSISITLREFICDKLELAPEQSYMQSSPLDLSFVSALEGRVRKLGRKKTDELFYRPLTPQKSPSVREDRPLIPQILQKDILLHYPFESIQPFIRLLDESATDPDVISIKITLYRVARDSQIVDALMRAAQHGKDVLVMVELRARFDEENNIDWSKQLEEAGCNVIYGLEEYKVHSKLLLVTRRSQDGIQYITQIGTGNYNEKTARLYTDLCLLTADKEIGLDASVVFNNLAIGSLVEYSKRLMVAPLCLKNRVIEFIDREIAMAEQGEEAYIGVKINSLSDKTIIDKLIEASQHHVKVDLIVRGICCLRSGVDGYTDNITVRSIVGRFLEHSRIYLFGPPQRQDIYISSADFMTRNTERRVEVAAPICDPDLKERIRSIFQIYLSDNVKCRVQQNDGSYQSVQTPENEAALYSQQYFYERAYENAALPAGTDKAPAQNVPGRKPANAQTAQSPEASDTSVTSDTEKQPARSNERQDGAALKAIDRAISLLTRIRNRMLRRQDGKD